MIKNFFKFSLGILVLCTGYLAIDAAHAICSAGVNQDICSYTELCEYAGGCTCSAPIPFSIGFNVMCTQPAPTSVSVDNACLDPNGCICNGHNLNMGDRCGRDLIKTAINDGQSCSDWDGCFCGTNTINNGDTCTISGGGGTPGGGSDTTPPTLTAGAVTNTGTATPSFTFTSNEAGTITYSGVCSSATTTATAASQTIVFNALATGTYNSCTLRVTDASANASLRLTVPTFTLIYTGTIPPPPGVGGGASAGGGSSQPKDNCSLPGSTLTGANLSGIDYSPSYYDGFCGQKTIVGSTYSNELNNAYLRAYSYDITTMDTIQKADMRGKLLRSHLAKMISNFALHLGGLTPNTGLNCDFVDVSQQTEELRGYITLACQLGLMGIDADGTPNMRFNPDELVDRAQFGTILSRVIRGTRYNGGTPRYGPHLDALNTANIMTLISQPYKIELRGYVMIMMRRTYEEGFLNH